MCVFLYFSNPILETDIIGWLIITSCYFITGASLQILAPTLEEPSSFETIIKYFNPICFSLYLFYTSVNRL